MTPRLCLNTATIRQAPFRDRFRIVREAGFSGIGLWTDDIDQYLSEGGALDDIRALLSENDLVVPEMSYLGGWQRLDGGSLPEAQEEARRLCRMTRDVGCPMIGAVPSRHVGDLGEAAEDLAALADIARDYGIVVGLEFYGSAGQIKSLDVALDVIARADRPNAGLLYDAFHFFLGESLFADVGKIPIDKLFMVHLSDAEDLPRERLFEYHKHRVLPGEGIAEVRRSVRGLIARGYDGWFSVEIFNDDYLPDDPSHLARCSREKAEDLFG